MHHQRTFEMIFAKFKAPAAFLLLGFFISESAPAESRANCDHLSAYSKVVIQATSPELEARLKAAKQLPLVRKQVSRRYVTEYLEGRLQEDLQLESCLGTDEANRFRSILGMQSYEMTRQHFMKQSEPFQRFATLVEQRNLSTFRVAGIGLGVNPSGKKGGFHSGTGSIFMDFSLIPSEEWPVIFIHEMAHGLDDSLRAAMDFYTDPTVLDRTTLVLQKLSAGSPLTAAERKFFKLRVQVELDRAFYSEYRAWVLATYLYQEGRRTQTIASINWMDQMLPTSPNITIERQVFDYLDRRFRPSREGLMSHPAAAAERDRQRAEARVTLPPLPETYRQILD